MHGDHAHGRALYIAIGIALVFMAVEIAGGYLANSLALISDALHMFTDVGALLLGLIVLRVAKWPRTKNMTYGYDRAEILGALASALSLWVLCAILIYEATLRFIHPAEVKGPIVFVIASIGLLANVWMMRILHPAQSHSLNVRAAYLHVVGDLLGSIGVILGGVLLWLFHWNPIDPIITIVFALAIVFGSAKIIKQTILVLMESSPPHIDAHAIERDLLSIPGVKEVHDLHIWSVSTKKIALSAHLVAKNPHATLTLSHQLIEKKYQIRHMTLQIEEPDAFESHFCYDCENSNK
jgi:cobalt-zinc-cadmium efflux system protein